MSTLSDIYFLEVKKSFYGFNGLLNLYFERSIDIALFRPLSKIELAGSQHQYQPGTMVKIGNITNKNRGKRAERISRHAPVCR